MMFPKIAIEPLMDCHPALLPSLNTTAFSKEPHHLLHRTLASSRSSGNSGPDSEFAAGQPGRQHQSRAAGLRCLKSSAGAATLPGWHTALRAGQRRQSRWGAARYNPDVASTAQQCLQSEGHNCLSNVQNGSAEFFKMCLLGSRDVPANAGSTDPTCCSVALGVAHMQAGTAAVHSSTDVMDCCRPSPSL